MADRPPQGEQGAVSFTLGGVTPWAGFIQEGEYSPDLMYPRSLKVYTKMPRDGQVKGLFRGTTLPIRRFRWMIDPNGAADEVVDHIAQDLGLPVRGQEPGSVGRRKKRFVHDKHLETALRGLQFGHYYFEQVGEIVDNKWRLKKLAARPPRIIQQINTEPDGGLRSIEVPAASKQRRGMTVELPVSRLVAYVWDAEPGDWVGESMLRAIYRNWLLKDRLMRVDVMKHERTGMGQPVIEAPPGASAKQIAELAAMAQKMKVSEQGGGAIPSGAKLNIQGTQGTIPDTWTSIRGHNEEMAQSWMMMLTQLGATATGSRALGDSFADVLVTVQEAIADWYRDITNEFVIEDIVDWTYGEAEPAPRLVYERDDPEKLAIADFVKLLDSGAIQMSPEDESALRERYGLPTTTTPRAGGGESVEARRRKPVRAAGSADLPLPDRTLRRQPYDHEVRAAVDYARIDSDFDSALEAVVAAYREAQEPQFDQLVEQAEAADGDLLELAALQADPVGADLILDAMKAAETAGIEQHMAEIKAQGLTPKRPPAGQFDEQYEERAEAMAQVLARELSAMAARQATRRTGNVQAAAVPAPEPLPDQLRKHFAGLTTSYLDDVLAGAVSGGINAGRQLTMVENGPEEIYSSELLDTNTCESCGQIDGTVFESVAEAEEYYPVGGYVYCHGMDRCRGTLVATYGESNA